MDFDSTPTGKATTALCFRLSLSRVPAETISLFHPLSLDNFDGFFDLLASQRVPKVTRYEFAL